MKRKLWMLLLAFVLVVLVVPTQASAAEVVDSGTCGENLTWELTADGVLTIDGVGEIEENPWSEHDNIISVEISHGITTICSYAFSGCDSLLNISIPNSVTFIGTKAFENCSNLKEIQIPDSVTRLGMGAFSGCGNLTGIHISAGMDTIAYQTFLDCDNLTQVILPEGVQAIGEEAFSSCDNLSEIILPETLTEIYQNAFYQCYKLANIDLPNTLTFIDMYAFRECGITQITIPSKVTKIWLGAFSDCKQLRNVIFMDGVSEIDAISFAGCDKLETVTFPSSLKEIREYAFKNCSNLTKITFNGDAPVMNMGAFSGVVAVGYYPASNETWSNEILRNVDHQGEITWIQYNQTEHAHSFGEWQEVTLATCVDEGIMQRTCSCGEVESKSILALGHDYKEGSCTVCGDEDPDYAEPTEPEESPVDRIAGGNRISTALTTADKLKEVMAVEKYNAIVVADAMNFPDALSGSYLAASAKAPILLYKDGQASVVEYIQKNLASGGKVYILGGTSSVPDSLMDQLPGIHCERVSGSGRWATSLAIIAKADSIRGTKPEKVLICDGTGFADSLSASATGLPILLVNGKGTLREDQKAYLESVRGAELYAIGGENTITPDLLKELDAYDENGVERIAGNGREQTSAAVAKTFFPEAKTAALASSLDFPDGLSGGPVAYAMGAPLLLTRENKEAAAMDYVNSKGITSGYIIGGEKAVSDATAQAVFGGSAVIE